MRSLKYLLPKMLRKILNRAAISNSDIDKTARCDIGCNVSNSTMGRYSYIGEFTSISNVNIGSFTAISSGCTIGGGNHPMEWASISPVFQNSGGLMRKKIAKNEFEPHVTTSIGNDVWIGGNCLVRGGVHIADGAVVGMGSVVLHDIGPYEVWAGNPAKKIRNRFDPIIIRRMLASQWWNLSDEKLSEFGKYITDPVDFLEKVEKK